MKIVAIDYESDPFNKAWQKIKLNSEYPLTANSISILYDDGAVISITTATTEALRKLMELELK